MFVAMESPVRPLSGIACVYALSRGVAQAVGIGRVHSVFASAIDIECADALVVLLEARHADVPHGIRLTAYDWPRVRALDVGAPCVLREQALELPSVSVHVDLTSAAVWGLDVTAFPWPERTHLESTYAKLRAAFDEHAASGPRHDALRAGYLHRLNRSCMILTQALGNRDAAAAAHALNALVGLGCGLTPSGDDFIIGCLAGLALGAAADADQLCLVRELCDHLVIANTTAVSRQYLRDACALRFARPLAELARAIVSAEPLAGKLAALLAVGGYSGADALSGLLAALSLRIYNYDKRHRGWQRDTRSYPGHTATPLR